MFRRLMKSRKLRARTSWIVAFILVPPFIFFFHMFGSPLQNGGSDAAGLLFGKPIPWDVYFEQYNQTRLRWQNRLAGPDGEPVELPEAFDALIVAETWDGLMLTEEAKRQRLRVSNQQLADVIRRDPLFQFDGRFLPERYRQILRAGGFTPRTYEPFLRNQLLAQQLINSVRSTVWVTDEEVHVAFVEANERLRASMIVIDPTTFQEEIRTALTEADLRTDYDERPQLVRTPAQVTFDYVGLNRDELTDTLIIPEEELRDAYEDTYEPEGFKIPSIADVTRDDVPLDEPVTEENAAPAFDEVREDLRAALLPQHISRRLNTLIFDLEDALDADQSFDELATALELPTRTVGPTPVGDLFAEGTPEPALLQAAFELEEDQMSEAIETDNGVYLLRVSRLIPSQVPPFEVVRGAIEERLVQERAREAARAAADEQHAQLTEQLEAGARIDEAAKALGLTLTEPEPFTRTDLIPSIGEAPLLNQKAFRTPIGQLTEVTSIPEGFVILVPQERLAPDEAAFADQEGVLRQQVLQEQQDIHYREWRAALRLRADLQSFVEPAAPSAPSFLPDDFVRPDFIQPDPPSEPSP